ncbi:uncharacterized protein [Lepeophtheirus salmonis]|uniref:Uncharacterized protein n=1 Tax=Lepeophtheirus salmonis TaxID=72036 RepID=A0A0K2U431_LEPSM|nr:uncharacterized protein LOC121127863 [Lepeophtheirus salmonis]
MKYSILLLMLLPCALGCKTSQRITNPYFKVRNELLRPIVCGDDIDCEFGYICHLTKSLCIPLSCESECPSVKSPFNQEILIKSRGCDVLSGFCIYDQNVFLKSTLPQLPVIQCTKDTDCSDSRKCEMFFNSKIRQHCIWVSNFMETYCQKDLHICARLKCQTEAQCPILFLKNDTYIGSCESKACSYSLDGTSS